MRKPILLACLVLLVIPSGLVAQKVERDWDKQVDFEQFKTFAYKVGPPS